MVYPSEKRLDKALIGYKDFSMYPIPDQSDSKFLIMLGVTDNLIVFNNKQHLFMPVPCLSVEYFFARSRSPNR